jgi:hypothetical protein
MRRINGKKRRSRLSPNQSGQRVTNMNCLNTRDIDCGQVRNRMHLSILGMKTITRLRGLRRPCMSTYAGTLLTNTIRKSYLVGPRELHSPKSEVVRTLPASKKKEEEERRGKKGRTRHRPGIATSTWSRWLWCSSSIVSWWEMVINVCNGCNC